MIAEAVYELLSTLPDTASLIEERVYPVAFAQAETLNSLTYNLKRRFSLTCRNGDSKTKYKLLEIGILADTAENLQTIYEKLDNSLEDYSGVHAGYLLEIDANDDDFDEDASEISALFKRLQFDLTATKL